MSHRAPVAALSALLASLRRLAQIAAAAGRHGLARTLGPRLIARLPWLKRRLPAAELSGPERLRTLLEEVGGTFIKFGQMLALQPDILSLAYCNALFKLLDQVEPFAFEEVERIVTEELGAGPDELFTTFERRPLATASVGQVHVATLGERKVAVKVQRPNVEREFANDIRLMVATMALIRFFRLKPLAWLIEPMTEFVEWSQEELDYRYEARYSERLRELAVDNPVQQVPRVETALTTRRVLVVEYLEGVTLLAYLRSLEAGDELLERRLVSRGFDHHRFAANVIENFLGDAFRHGIYHADLHPANLMILADSVVGYIDFGITGVISPYSRRHLAIMTLALAEGDMQGVNDHFLKVSVHGPSSDLPAFRRGLDRLAEGWYRPGSDGDVRSLAVNFTRIMTDMLQLSRATEVMPERDIIKYIRSSIAIDGLVTRFAPEFELGPYLAESCGRFLHWQKRRQLLDVGRLLDGAEAGGELLASGAQRASLLLDRLATGELPARLAVDDRGPVSEAGRHSRVLLAALALLATTALLFFAPAPTGPGLNLWTAEATVAAALFGRVMIDLWRLA